LPGTAEAAAAADGTGPDPAGSDATATTPGAAPVNRSFRAPRRRRRHAPLSGTPAADLPGAAAVGGSLGQGAPGAEPGSRPARPRNRRGERPRAAGAPGDAQRQDAGRQDAGRQDAGRQDAGRQDAGRQNAGRQDAPRDNRGDRSRDAGPRANPRDPRRDRPPGRGRAEAPRRVERKLYSLDSVVDRGFEDVEEEAGTRRVHWTIVKRTTADQISRKPVSALYVVQRDGIDSEFPNLGAARNAVNKTIVHPEKLTRSKAEYAAEKK
jgi:hypothetical protein